MHRLAYLLSLALVLAVGCAKEPPAAPPEAEPAPPAAEPASESAPARASEPPAPEPAPEPEPEAEPVATDDAALEKALTRIDALSAAAAFNDAYVTAREARATFRSHPRAAELTALVARLKEAKREAAPLPFALKKLASPDPSVVEVARRELKAAGDVGAAVLRQAVREADAAVAVEAARTLATMDDPRAPAAFHARLQADPPEALRTVLVRGLRDQIADLPAEALHHLHAAVKADADHARRDLADLLMAALHERAGGDAAAYDELLGEGGAYDVLKGYVRTATESENPDVVAWGAARSAAFGLVVAYADMVLWLQAGGGAETDTQGRLQRWRDQSKAGNHATQETADARPTVVEDGGRAAVRFDGADDWLALPEGLETFSQGVSFSAWGKPTKKGNWQRFIDLGNGPEQDNIVLARNSGSDSISFYCYAGSSRADIPISPPVLKLGVWQHLVGTLDAEGRVVIYYNGKPVLESKTSVPRDVLRKSNLIAKSNWGTTGDALYEGLMDDLRIYRRALTPEEVARLYQTGKRTP